MKTINKNVCQWCGSKNIESFANDSEYSDITYQYFICNDCGAMYRFKGEACVDNDRKKDKKKPSSFTRCNPDTLADNSIATSITDTQYGAGIYGKEWDTFDKSNSFAEMRTKCF
jgi:hypothetical protein